MKVAVMTDVPYYLNKLREVADERGVEIALCASVDSIPPEVDRIFVDLSATTFDPIQAISSAKAIRNTPITAFVSGVQIDMRERAEKAGADEVLPRSILVERIEDALRI